VSRSPRDTPFGPGELGRDLSLGRRLVPAHVEVVAVLGPFPDALDGSTWPCLACGERRPLSDGIRVTIRNRTGPAFEREACVCGSCADVLTA
jgi:hypothetical protein